MKSKKQDVKGDFLLELISARNAWLSKVEIGNTDNDKCLEYAQAYERLIFAFTSPVDKTNP
jgi:hypothetical protein